MQRWELYRPKDGPDRMVKVLAMDEIRLTHYVLYSEAMEEIEACREGSRRHTLWAKTEIEKRDEEIAELKNKLVSNRGCIGYTIELEQKISALTIELSRLTALIAEQDKVIVKLEAEKVFADAYKRVCEFLGIEKDIIGFFSRLTTENERLKGEATSWEKSHSIEWEQAEKAINKLERLTTLINDASRVEKVVKNINYLDDYLVESYMKHAINDYRTMLEGEISHE